MSEPAALFARLTGQLEDMHGLAVEGQVADQPVEVLVALVANVAAALQGAGRTLRDIRLSLPDV